MRKLIVTSIGALFSLAALGQEDLLQCVNPDVVKGLLFNGPASQMSITAALPESMAGFTVPPGFTLIGTSTAPDGSYSTVSLRTSADSEAAFATILGTFEAEGWVVEEEQRPMAPIFILESEPVSGTVCRQSVRRNLRVQEVNGRRYVIISLTNQPNTVGCNITDPRLAGMAMSMMSLLSDEAPRLRLPEGTTAADGSDRISGSGGGSGETFLTDEQIRIAQSAASFMNELSAQMDEQGWNVDTAWSGTLSNGARWTRTASNGFPYWATLELVDVGGGIHDLSFRLMMPPN